MGVARRRPATLAESLTRRVPAVFINNAELNAGAVAVIGCRDAVVPVELAEKGP